MASTFMKLLYDGGINRFGAKARKAVTNEYQQVRSTMNPVMQQMVAINQLQTDICNESSFRGLILGVYSNDTGTPPNSMETGLLTTSAWRFNLQRTNGRLLEVLRMSGSMPKRGEARILFCIEPDRVPQFAAIAMVGLGKECLGYNPYEVIDEEKEAIRNSVGKACMELSALNMRAIEVESCGHAESAAEGAALGIWKYQQYKDPKMQTRIPTVDLHFSKDEVSDIEGWRIGLQKAAAQNLTRELQEMPANILTPTSFAQNVVEVLCNSGVNVEVKVEGWAESQSMNAFLAVSRASCKPPIFLELSYYGTCSDEKPIVLVGQGITYDTGGLCLKEIGELKHMRADMTGAAVVVATCRAVAALRLPINIRGLIPLCENMIGCNSYRPGDIYKAVNGKTIEVQCTDHEDVLVLADALLYAQNFCPKCIIDVGTTSGQMRDALDEAACGIFTNSEILWQQIKHASVHTGDRVWRLPLWHYYTKQVTVYGRGDIKNYGTGRGGRPCKAAAFLREFVPCGQWMHIDVTSVVRSNGKHYSYLRRGMAGRPTRTLIEFIAQTICRNTATKSDVETKA